MDQIDMMFSKANYSEHLYILCLNIHMWSLLGWWMDMEYSAHTDCNLEKNLFFSVNIFLHISKIVAKALHAVCICLPV